MTLLQAKDAYGGTAYFSAEDRQRALEAGNRLIPLRFRTGTRLSAVPPGLRPNCTNIHPENIITDTISEV